MITFAAILACLFLSVKVSGLTPENIQFLGDYPGKTGSNFIRRIRSHDKRGRWTEGLQGIGNDRENWFFTQLTALWKVPYSINLRGSKKMWPNSNFPGVLRVEMPDFLKQQGFNHFGDLDVEEGYIFIPVERGGGREAAIAVFDAEDLRFIDYTLLAGRTHSGWCSVAPNGQLFTSHNVIDSHHPIYVYDIDWQILRSQEKLRLSRSRDFFLKEIPVRLGVGLSTFMQGGDFSSDGKYLFLLNGQVAGATLGDDVQRIEDGFRGANPVEIGRGVAGGAEDILNGSAFSKTRGRGVWIFRNNNYESASFLMKSSQRGGKLEYTFKPGVAQEPEGLSYSDLDARQGSVSEADVGGQLHAILLKKRPKTDGVWIKHYRLPRPLPVAAPIPEGSLSHGVSTGTPRQQNYSFRISGGGDNSQCWTETDFPVYPGWQNRFNIRVESGRWNYGGSGGQFVDANGHDNNYLDETIMPNENFASLIARIGDGEPFHVGLDKQDIVSRSTSKEKLFLSMNDVPDKCDDNSGYIEGEISFSSPG